MFEKRMKERRDALIASMTRAIDRSCDLHWVDLTDEDWAEIYETLRFDVSVDMSSEGPVFRVQFGDGDNDCFQASFDDVLNAWFYGGREGPAEEFDRFADILEGMAKKLRTARGRVTLAEKARWATPAPDTCG